ncbi:MAG TPA: hypothetical protein DEQ20_02195 [Desulfobulbaceae bacterium]|nr:MAG: hypothetical protein A2520_03710 [Deltaproteobacteria bacterium RIFOXYD12_FULL_53_23]HCC53729.1 hypothetical protein [Desulfobulbaceae bacterium]
MSIICKGLIAFLLLFPSATWAAESALITAVKGAVWVEDAKHEHIALRTFIKLHEGDNLQLGENASLQLIYFKSANQETWLGPGNIVIGEDKSKAITTQLQPQIKHLSTQFTTQLAKTPTTDSRGKIAVVRTRAFGPSANIEQVKRTYIDMCAKSEANDRNPELYLLSAYFEIKEYELVRETLTQLEARYPDYPEVKLLKSLYAKAINNAKMAAKQ